LYYAEQIAQTLSNRQPAIQTEFRQGQFLGQRQHLDIFGLWRDFCHRFIPLERDDLEPLLYAFHRGEIIFGHGLIVGAGVDHGGTEFLVTQEALNGRDAAARVQQLRGPIHLRRRRKACQIRDGQCTILFVGAHYEVKNGSEITKYYYASGQRIAMRKNGTLYYMLSDHLGSTSLTLSSSGSKIAELRYKAWGETRYTSGTTYTAYQFTAQRNETSLGLYFYREASRRDNARWYDPYLNRFTSADTIVPTSKEGEVNPYLIVNYNENAFLYQLNRHNVEVLAERRGERILSTEQINVDIQGFDRFAYTRNNPVNYTDPTGHCADPASGTLCWALLPTGPVGWAIIGGLLVVDVILVVNAVEHVASLTESTTAEVSTSDLATQMRGEYIPPGLKGLERDLYREALHRYKDAYGLGPRDNVPKDILDKIGELTKKGVKPSDVVNQAPAPPEEDWEDNYDDRE